MFPWRTVGVVVALALFAIGIGIAVTMPGTTPYQASTQTAVQNITQNPTNNPTTNPGTAPSSPPPSNPPPSGGGTGGGGTGGGGGGGHGYIPISILGGNPGAVDIAIFMAGGLILMAIVFSLFRGAWTTVKVVALVLLLVTGSVGILAASEYVDSVMLPYSAPPGANGTANGTVNSAIPLVGTIYFSGSVGFTNGGTSALSGTQTVSSVAYNQVQVAALSLRVDAILSCANCSFSITRGFAVIHTSQIPSTGAPPPGHADLRNTTYRPLAFASGASVNLYTQSFNASQVETNMQTIDNLACSGPSGVSETFSYNVTGSFTLLVTAGGATLTRTIVFGWSGLRLIRQVPDCSSSQGGGGGHHYKASVVEYGFTGFSFPFFFGRR